MKELSLKLKIWRQKNQDDEGRFIEYDIDGLNEHMSFLEMLDVLNERLISNGEEPIAFDHDCREGICGSCAMVINGKPHGPLKGTTSCQLHMYHFNDGDTFNWFGRSAITSFNSFTLLFYFFHFSAFVVGRGRE